MPDLNEINNIAYSEGDLVCVKTNAGLRLVHVEARMLVENKPGFEAYATGDFGTVTYHLDANVICVEG